MFKGPGEQQLVGKRRSDPEDPAAIREYGEVSLDFSPSAELTYTVHGEETRQIMLLTYRVEADVLITDQPSAPKEERTKFEITPSGKFVLQYEHHLSMYVRVDEPATPFPAISLN